MNNYNEFCKDIGCEEYIEWGCDGGACVSCQRIGQSHDIEEYPDDCPNITKIKQLDVTG